MQIRPVGAHALLVEVADGEAVEAWRAELWRRRATGDLAAVEIVPGARTVLVDGVPDPASLAEKLPGWAPPVGAASAPGALVSIPLRYDGEDLPAVAAHWGVTTDEAVARHLATEFRVAFCGFAPGFAYLTGLPEGLAVPRLATPRTRVPAGSVALADAYCGIYPRESPGGWLLIGRTDAVLFDVRRDPPALLAPRDAREVRGVIEMRAAGPLTTVQDLGRPGHAHLGVARSGALDPPALRLANRVVGNDPGTAGLEVTMTGCAIRCLHPATVAVTGAPARITKGRRECRYGAAIPLGPGDVIEIGPALAGVRSYIAVAGGIDVPPVLGSRSTDTLSGLGPAPLRTGDVLPIGLLQRDVPPPSVEFVPRQPAGGPVHLRLRFGPRDDWFTPEARQLLSEPYTLGMEANRVGARLAGPALPRADAARQLPSEGVVLGAVQVTPDGRPLVFLADHPTTAGYPVIGVVDEADLPALAQARPGDTVVFHGSER